MSKKVDIKRGSTVVAVGEGLEYHGEWMQHGYVTVTVKSAVKIDFQVGDYVVFRGEKFYLWGEESWKKQARSNSYGEAYVYENMKFYDTSILLEQVSFRDFVLNWDSDANVNTYSSLGKFTFFGADVDDLADRIQANLDRVALTIGSDLISFKVLTSNESRSEQRGASDSEWESYYDNGSGGVSETSKTDIVVNVDSETLWGGLARAYNDFGMSFFVDGGSYDENNVVYIVIGAPVTSISGNAFVYGKGHELKTIEQHTDDQQRIVTRLFAYGSTKNVPANYYANQFRRPFILGTKTTEINVGTPGYYVETSYLTRDLYKGIPNTDSPSVKVTITKNNVTYNGVGYITGTNHDGTTEEYGVLSLNDYVWIDGVQVYGEQTAAQFYAAIADNDKLYITYGVSVNGWPASLIETDSAYNSMLVIQNLMLPGFPTQSLYDWVHENVATLIEHGMTAAEILSVDYSTDINAPWIQSKNVNQYGVREGDVYFDGSGDMEEIYPTIANTGANSVQSAEGFDDHGYLDEGGTFTMQVLDSGIEWDKLYANGMTISMTSGFCTGRDFTVEKKPVKTNGSWTFTLARVQDERGCFLPNVDSPIESGDVFIVSGIELPAEYVEAASEALLRAAIAAIKENDEPKRTYTPSIDNIYMAKDLQANGANALHYKLRAGAAVAIQLDDAGTQNSEVIASVIDALTIKDDGGDGIAHYEITLRDEKEKTLTQTISEAVSKGSGGGGGSAATSGRAYRLSDSTPRTAWGRQYWENGQPKDVSGTIDDAIDINMSGTLSIDGFEVSKDADGRLMHDGNIYATGSVAALGYSAAGGGSSVVLGPLLAGLNDEPMPVADGYLHWTGSAFEWVEPGGGGDVPGTVAWNNITGKPATFPPSEHNHDERYYISNGTIHLGSGSITPITSHQSLAAYTPTANYQALNIKVGSTVVGTYAPTQALNFSIVAGSNISVTADATNKKITIANTYSYTHPTNGANTTITAANGKVLSAITVNNLGHVTSVGSKTLGPADIPELDASKITSGTFDVARIPDLSSIYLLKVAGESYPITNSLYVGSTTNKGVYVKDPAGNYVPAFYQNGENLWIGSRETLSTHHNGRTYISAGHDGTHGNPTIYISVPNDANNGGSNYGVWHSGNDGSGSGLDADLLDGHDSGYFATASALTTLAGTVSTQGGRITTLEGYFDNGVANSAKRLSGTASYTVWGQTYWENGVPKGNVKDTLYMLSSESGVSVNTDSAKLKFNSYDADTTTRVRRSPYIQALWEGSYGRKRLSVFQSNEGTFDPDLSLHPFVEVFTIKPNGNVGIGTSAPSQKLHVVGNIMATGAVSCLGTSAEGSEVTGAVYLRDLQDVLITGTPQTNYVLTFNGSKWVPQASQGGDMSNWKVKDAQVVEDNSLVLNGEDVIYGAELASNGMLTLKSTRLSIAVPENTSDLVNDSGFISQTTADGRYLKLSGGQMSNTNRVVNLNADLLDGKHASDFVPKAGYFYQMDGTAVTPSRILLPLAAGSTGTYSLDLSGYLPLTAGADKALTGQLYLDTGSTTEVYVNVKSNRATANGGGWAFPLITARNAAGTSVFSMGVYGAAADLNYAYIGAGAWNAANNLRVYTDGSVSLGNNIKYQGTKAVYNMISFIDNTTDTYGNGIAIGGGGATIIGGGESASVMASQLSSGGSELMYIGNDQGVSIFTYLQNGWDYRKEFYFGTDGNLTMENASYIYFKNSGGTAQNAIGLNSTNAFLLGYGTARSGYETYLDGKYISIRTFPDNGANSLERIRITAAGDVGIGTSQPGQKLHVNGNIAGDSLWLPVAGSVYINDKNMLTYNSSQMLSLGYGMRDITGTKTDIYGKQVEIKEQKLKIGDCIIEWDSTHGMLKFSNGIYSMGAVSALGVAGDINGVVTKPMTFAADVTIGQYTQNNVTQSYKLNLGDSSHYLRKRANSIEVFGSTVFQSTMDINNDLNVTGDINAESDIFCEGKISVEEEVEFMIEGQAVGTLWVDHAGSLYWKKNGASQSTKIA